MTVVGPIDCVPVGASGEALFACRVCGVQCPVADPKAGAICEEHCPDHEYVYERGEGHRCKHCFASPPADWHDVD